MTVHGYKIEPGADLSYASLQFEDLTGADLSGAKLRYANLGDAVLTGANLQGANLIRANLGDANLRGANLRGADFDLSNLAGANLAGADLTGAWLRWASLFGATLTGADLTGADLESTRFWCADLSGVVLTDKQLQDGNFSGAIIDGVRHGYISPAFDKTLRELIKKEDYAREVYVNTDVDNFYDDYVEAADELISRIMDSTQRALAIMMPRGEHRLKVIKELRNVAGAIHAYNDNESEDPSADLADNLIYHLDVAFRKILDPTATEALKANIAAFLSEIGFKLDVEVTVTAENQDSILARLDQISSDVARLAGISKEDTPAKTVLAAIEASNLTPEIMELVSDAVLDCAEME